MSGCLEPVFGTMQGYRRIYFDMPGMGKTPPARWIQNGKHMLEVIMEFINEVIPEENFLVLGESYGGYMTLGLVAEMPERIDGAVLLCPGLTEEFGNLPPKQILWKSPELASPEEDPDIKAFYKFAVIATPEKFSKYKSDVLSGIKISDGDFLSNYFDCKCRPDIYAALQTAAFDKPSCIITGRQDHGVGYSDAYNILDRFPRATYAVVDCAGHNLQIDNEPLFGHLIRDWIWRVELSQTTI